MDANYYWPVVIESPSGKQLVCAVAYPRRPTPDLAAGLVRPQLGMDLRIPDQFRYRENACLLALEAAGYRIVKVGP